MEYIKPLRLEVRILATPATLWKAFTRPEEMKEWYFDIPGFRAETGYEFSFSGGSEEKTYIHRCKITEVVPEKKLSYTWRYEVYPGESEVIFELKEEKNGTLVTVTHTGLETFPDEADFSRSSFEKGWAHIIGTSLVEQVETGSTLKDISIHADKNTIWNKLLEATNKESWASAFGEGTYVEGGWEEGDLMEWKTQEGDTVAKGIVTRHEPGSILEIKYYDDVQMHPPQPTGDYTEVYALARNEKGCILSIDCGPLQKKYLKSHEELWEKALELLKSQAEK